MNCSCTGQRCPHLRYIRSLLETSEKEQIPSPPISASRQTSTSENASWWIRWRSPILETMDLLRCVLQTLLACWMVIARLCLHLWLRLLDCQRPAMLMFLFFSLSLVCSLPGVRASMPSQLAGTEIVNYDLTMVRKSVSALPAA